MHKLVHLCGVVVWTFGVGCQPHGVYEDKPESATFAAEFATSSLSRLSKPIWGSGYLRVTRHDAGRVDRTQQEPGGVYEEST
jgi:hypothetical protein